MEVSSNEILGIEDFLLPPLLGTVLCVLFHLGLWSISSRLNKHFNLSHTVLNHFLIYLSLLLLVSNAVIVLTLSNWAKPVYLRILVSPILFFGLVGSINWMRHNWIKFSIPKIEDPIYLLNNAIIVGYFLVSLGPLTDADSIAYHLAVPLEILKFDIFSIPVTWLDAHLIGTGEFLNLLGLGLGADNMGAISQFFCLFLLVRIIRELFVDTTRAESLLLLILSLPILLFLIPTQKPQLSGIVAQVVLFVTLFISKKDFNTPLFSFAFAFMLSLKYSFFLTGAPLILFFLYKHGLSYGVRAGLMISFSLLPLFLLKWMVFGNPISPILSSSQEAVDFVKFLKSYHEGFLFPLNLIVPNSVGNFTTTLGIGLVVLLILTWKNRTVLRNEYGLIIISQIVLIVFFGQNNSRFYMSTVCALAVYLFYFGEIGNAWKNLKSVVIAQSAVIMAALIYLSYFFVPALFSPSKRDSVQKIMAYTYESSKELEDVLPEDASVILTRNTLFLKRNIIHDKKSNWKKYPRLKGKLFMVSHQKMNDKSLREYRQLEITKATRNPVNQKTSTRWIYLVE